MNLTLAQRPKLLKALLSAFPTLPSLEQMVRLQLGDNLAVIVASGSLGDVVFRLVEWAEAQGKLEALVHAAGEQVPGNPLLAAIVEELLTGTAVPEPEVVPSARSGVPELSTEQFNVLLEALLACPSIRIPAQRAEVILNLPVGISDQVVVTGAPRPDALRMLRASVNFPNGLDRLVAAVQLLDGEALAFVEFRATVSRVNLGQKLALLLAGIPAATAREWYSRSLRSAPGARADAGNRSVGELAADLADWGLLPDDSLPLATFAEGLAGQHLNAQGRAEVRVVVEDFARAEEIPLETLTRQREQLAAELAPAAPGETMASGRLPPSVLVEIRATAGKPPTYTALVHLWEPVDPPLPRGARGRTRLLHQFQSLPDLDRLRDAVSEALGEVVRGFPTGTPEPLIEFMVPVTLLGLEVDQWPIVKDSFGEPTPLGMEFAVVLRSYERWGDPGLRDVIRHRWPRNNQASIYWLDQPKTRQLLYAELKAGTDACVALSFPYGAETADLLLAPLRAGVPIAVWLRKPVSAPPSLRERLELLLKLDQSSTWPDLLKRVRQLRIEAEIARLQALETPGALSIPGESLHPGLCLAVLWDDPDRFVEKPPAAQG